MKQKSNKRQTFIIEDDGTVKCSYNRRLTIHDDLEECCNERIVHNIIETIDEAYGIEHKFTNDIGNFKASAVCSDEDEYDDKVGIDIAGCKSHWKFHNNMAARYKTYIRKLNFIILKLQRRKEFHEKKAERISHYLREK